MKSLQEQLRPIKFDLGLSEDSEPYRSHEWLISRARHCPPLRRSNVVSSFSSWMFDLCKLQRNDESLRLGKLGEHEIERYRRCLGAAKPPASEGMSLEFADPLDGSAKALKISALRLNDKPLFGIPDVVFRGKQGEVYIFERKVTQSRVPEFGWPNLKVQLWCYSWIDQWLGAPEVYLIGEIWTLKNGKLEPSQKVPRWRRSDPAFREECEELFRHFGGTFHLPKQK